MLLRVEVASFHPQRAVLSTTRHDSSLWSCSSPCGAWALPSTLLCGARTFLWQLKHLPATVWPASAAILPHCVTGGLTSGVPRGKNDPRVVFRRGDEHETQNVLPVARSGQRHPNGQRSAARAGRRWAHAFPRQARDVSGSVARSELSAEVRRSAWGRIGICNWGPGRVSDRHLHLSHAARGSHA